MTDPEDMTWGSPCLEEWLRRQMASRREVAAECQAWRVAQGTPVEWDGVTVDQFGPVWLVSTTHHGPPIGWQGAVAEGLCQSVWYRSLDRNAKTAPECVAGEPVEKLTVAEDGLPFEIQPGAGYNCGLFLDQRLNRRRVRQRVQPGDRVLNLFSYTCSFSAVAAAAGAVVTSVDLNAGYLEWGKRNLALQGLDPAAHFWIKGDSFDWLAAFAKKGRSFDGVILDPPTFSRGTTKKVFRVEKDYAELAALAAAVIAPGGWLLACANTHRQGAAEFEAQVDAGLRQAGVKFAEREWLPMPPDFAGAEYLKGLWLGARSDAHRQ